MACLSPWLPCLPAHAHTCLYSRDRKVTDRQWRRDSACLPCWVYRAAPPSSCPSSLILSHWLQHLPSHQERLCLGYFAFSAGEKVRHKILKAPLSVSAGRTQPGWPQQTGQPVKKSWLPANTTPSRPSVFDISFLKLFFIPWKPIPFHSIPETWKPGNRIWFHSFDPPLFLPLTIPASHYYY